MKNCDQYKSVKFDNLSKRSSPLTINYLIRAALFFTCLLKLKIKNFFN